MMHFNNTVFKHTIDFFKTLVNSWIAECIDYERQLVHEILVNNSNVTTSITVQVCSLQSNTLRRFKFLKVVFLSISCTLKASEIIIHMWQTQTDSCAFGHICEYKQTFKQESVKVTLIHIELQEQSHIYVQMQCCFLLTYVGQWQ